MALNCGPALFDHGTEEARGRGLGWDYVHVAIDDQSRLTYAEVLTDDPPHRMNNVSGRYT